MEDTQVIVSLARRNLELQEEIDTLVVNYGKACQARDNLQGWMNNIQKAMGYDGHPAHMAEIIKDLKDN